MKKYEIQIREKLTYTKTATIEVPDTMTDQEFEKILNTLERKTDSSADMPYVAEKLCVTMVVDNPDDWSSPDYSEVEIEEYEEVSE